MKTLSVGSAMIDTIAVIAPERIERMAMANADKAYLLMEEGKKTEADAVSNHLGGGAVNTAVSFSRLGCEAGLLARLGADVRGDQVVAELNEQGVSTAYIIRDDKTPTGASVILSSHDRNAGIFTFRGANTKLVKNDLTDAAFAVDLVHLGSLSNESAALYPLLVEKASAAGARVSANPGMRQLTSRAQDFLNVLPKIDILMINRVEAEALMPSLIPKVGECGPKLDAKNGKLPKLVSRGLMGGGFEMTLRRFLAALGDITTGTIVITDGGEGAYIARDGRLLFCPAVEAEIAGTAGAGDAFASTFAALTAEGSDIEAAARAASVNAASVISHVDTQTGLLTKDAIDSEVKSEAFKGDMLEWVI